MSNSESSPTGDAPIPRQSDSSARATNADGLDGTVFICDNLPFLKSLDTESIDLVCIDPPFGKKQTFVGELKPRLEPWERDHERRLMESWGAYNLETADELGIEYPDQSGATAQFRDIWTFRNRITKEWMDRLAAICPAAYSLVLTTRKTHSESIAAYLAFMVERVLEVRRVLKRTGSIYLHCDHEANAYLRQLMDAVFGHENFRNEIVWCYTGPANTRRWFPRKHDTILFYSKSVDNKFNREDVLIPYSEAYVERFKKGYNENVGASRIFAGGHDTDRNRELAKLGKLPEDWWLEGRDDMSPVGRGSEHTGYPTQKPWNLAKRIILASSDPGDIVLDCFAGCAYVPVAAELTGRRWIACDMSPRAWTVMRRQFSKHPDLQIVTEGGLGDLNDADDVCFEPRLVREIKVRGPNQLPVRTTPDVEPPIQQSIPPTIRFRQTPLETGDEIFKSFVDEWGPRCWYCDSERYPDRRDLHHVEPDLHDGSNDDCWNRALACAICNNNKSDKLTPEQTVRMAREQGLIKTDALYEEVLQGFKRRHEWATFRWETEIKPKASKQML